jgi:hypothetical protein
VTVFELVENGIPSTEKLALAPDVAVNVSPVADGIVKPAALPDELATIESRAPLASVITLAVTPSESLLMVAASSVSVLPAALLPTGMVVVVVPTLMLKLPEESCVLLEAT